MSQKVIIASKNPVKIHASKAGFERMFPDAEFEYEGISVPSYVNDQPISDRETFEGALNRVNNAKRKFPEASYWVGIEGGIESFQDEMEAFAWVVIKSTTKTGKARTATFFLPSQVIDLITAGRELGEADDIVFGHTDSKQKMGAVGILTDSVITRATYYAEAIVLALIPFKNTELY